MIDFIKYRLHPAGHIDIITTCVSMTFNYLVCVDAGACVLILKASTFEYMALTV